ncbi:hypothetical protein ACMA5I_14055 [Paracoccaceae bacterium GXU_MW_L88]
MVSRVPNPRTIATLDRLYEADWFSNVGVQDLGDAVVLSSWDQAMEKLADDHWEEIGLEAINNFRSSVLSRDKEKFKEWNEIVSTVKPYAESISNEKCAPIAKKFGLTDLFISSVKWDILNLCMECEYGDISPPAFYHYLSYYYLKGHFPCGMIGGGRDGRLIVY